MAADKTPAKYQARNHQFFVRADDPPGDSTGGR
jgi:hypothetical protein